MATRKDITEQLSKLRELFASVANGLSIEDVATRSNLNLDRRTFLRRLQTLLDAGDIVTSGKGRATRYASVRGETSSATPAQADLFVPVSKGGGEAFRLVSRPLSERKPVGYNRHFLDTYRPNTSHYLSPAEIKRLREISKTAETSDQPAGTHAHRILGRLLIDLSWNSSRLEGNTYSLLDTQRLIEAGEAADGKASTDAQMILNHKAAIEFLVRSANEIGFDRYTILNLHALLAENLLPDPNAAGRLRAIPVTIGKSLYHPPEVPQVLEECFDQVLATAAAIEDPFEQSFFTMVQMPYLQPFEDVNKRVSRLAANIPFIKKNLSPLSFVDVPDETYTRGTLAVYELNRVELLRDVFLWAYERSAARYAAIRQTIGDPDPFRFRFRLQIKEVIADVIRKTMDKKAATAYIAKWASSNLQVPDQHRFIEVTETELMGLHEGNFARYKIRPSEYKSWSKRWM
jgi:Fic family protein